MLSCAKRRGVEFCYQCGEYPCKKYDTATLYDSFITHQTMMRNFERAKTAGLGSYQGELNEKMRILRHLLDDYDDGRRKSFFCLAVDLLALQDLKDVMEQILRRAAQDAPVKEKAALAAALLQETAQRREITLKLHKKTKA